MRKIILITFFCFSAKISIAQQYTSNLPGASGDYPNLLLTNNNVAQTLTNDKRCSIWLESADGVLKFRNVNGLGFAFRDVANTWDMVTVTNSGWMGIGTKNPGSLFQVDDGCTRACIGDASGPGLNWGTSYLGFNASRTFTGDWTNYSWNTISDGVNNGGGVIYTNILGDMYFSLIPSTVGASGRVLDDHGIMNNIALKISHTNGAVYAKQVFVQTGIAPDYVFKPSYHLLSLQDIKAYIDKNQHLPEIPSATDIQKDGLNVGEMNLALLKKVEQLTLYLIEKDKEVKALQQNQEEQNARFQKLENELKKLIETKK